ncbi:hypothetical protein HYW74_03320 [Candidatus Pacearchaeota archaeon]|nr:hypothetical protein [Candidatus Pacearchaeota archaeon]
MSKSEEEKNYFFGISKLRAFYASGEDTSEWGTDWSYEVFLLNKQSNSVSHSPHFFISLNNIFLDDAAKKIYNYWKSHKDKVNLAVIPYNSSINSGNEIGIYLGRGYGIPNFQIGQVSDEELRRLGVFILDLQKEEEKSETLETLAQSR